MNKKSEDQLGSKVDLKLFLALWNRLQHFKTPHIHFEIADWLEKSWNNKDVRLLLQAFRSCGKSTIVGIYAAWLLYQDPNLRILVLAADSMLAKKMVRNVKRIVERHPLTAHLKPQKVDQWGSDRFTIERPLELRDPSMLGRGISSNLTGSRADIIICDDVEVPNTCDTAAKREGLREYLSEAMFVLTPGGTSLYVGTPHSWYSLYARDPRTEIGEETSFLHHYKRLTLPVLTPNGQSAWPERYTLDDIEQMRQSAGPNKFKSQMMLEPVNIAEGHLDPDNLQFYEISIQKSDELRGLYIKGNRLVSASAWWDPSFGRKHNDSSVLAVVFTDEEGRHYLHHLEYLRVNTADETDEATQQCRIIAHIAKRFYLPSITLEINGIGRFLPNILRRELSCAHVPCAVVEVSNTRPKDLRILEAFDAVLAARSLHVHKDVQKTPFIAEMQGWKPGQRSARDDGLDAVAGALSREPVRLSRHNSAGRQDWMQNKSSKGFTAKTEFDV